MENVAIVAITKNGLKIAHKIKQLYPGWHIYAPSKFSEKTIDANWYEEQTSAKIAEIFYKYDGMVCVFSLGAVIRLICPYLEDKKKDPAVIVIDDKANFVISALSGHLGGANELTTQIARKLGSTAVITTAADVNKTIPVDLVGREFGWTIENESNVTKVSAMMVNEEKIGIYQDAGQRDWWRSELPKNVIIFDSLDSMAGSDCAAFLIISDRLIEPQISKKAVIYRPKTLVAGIGLHTDTKKEKIIQSLYECLTAHGFSPKSVAKLASIKKPQQIQSLSDAAEELGIDVQYFEKEELAQIKIPNPSGVVEAFEGTPSVAEAAALKASGSVLVIEKQKFPPDLTVAVAKLQ